MEKEFKVIESVKFINEKQTSLITNSSNLLKTYYVDGVIGDRIDNPKDWFKLSNDNEEDEVSEFNYDNENVTIKFLFPNFSTEYSRERYQVIECIRDWKFNVRKLINFLEMNLSVVSNPAKGNKLVLKSINLYKGNYVVPELELVNETLDLVYKFNDYLERE